MKNEIEILEGHLEKLIEYRNDIRKANPPNINVITAISKDIRETADTINRMKDRRRDRYPARRNPYLPDPFTYTGEGPGNRNNA